MTTLREVRHRKVPKLIFGPFHVERAYSKDAAFFYQWFKRGENRFIANGVHGNSGGVIFDAYDRGEKVLPYEEYREAYMKDAAQHTRRRFAAIPLKTRKGRPR